MTPPRDEATNRQVQAANPENSTWLSANAGSGKTRVLTDRVARLLLNRVQPQHILCLTYTKAAASEMQNRLFRRLGEWAMLEDGALRSKLADLGLDHPLDDTELRNARTLFARAIETPGGLKIQTIHSFCSSLLRRFPLESGVSPQFAEMEERAIALLRAEVVQGMADGPQAALVDGVAQYHTGGDFDDLTAAITNARGAFAQAPQAGDIWSWLNLPKGFDRAALLESVFLGGEGAFLDQVAQVMGQGTSTDITHAARLAALTPGTLDALEEMEGIFLTGASAKEPFSAKLGTVPTKKTGEALGDLLPQLHDLMRRVEAAREARLALATAEKTLALHRFAQAFLTEYEHRKTLRGWLDFDDLIFKARNLLTDPAVAEWVLYRLDGGIDHILVDEAQDTSPEQWRVIELLAQEFTSGAGARPDTPRTIFVVGDKKQSIYSFQGADPREFDRMRADFDARLQDAGRPLATFELEHSFRSAQIILDLVDQCFEGRASSGFSVGSRHRAFKSAMPGRVDLWPLIEPADTDDDNEKWHDPVDRLGKRHHMVQLAQRIAAEIRRMIDVKETIPAENAPNAMRPVREGDFLILVQRRSILFQEVIRACKEQRLAIAGADRLKVGAELAVRDLAALMAFLATPDDDLSLAVALKSPLLGWTEAQLYALAQPRKGRLWPALRDRADEYPQTMAMLTDLRDHTDFLRPYDLIERILTRHQGRRHLLARLGPEAEDGINAFLAQALAYERSAVPSLTGFLQWMETDDLEIKRQMDSAGNRIRVMTVHGAKGLESPIVILPDTGKRNLRGADSIIVDQGQALWRLNGKSLPARLQDATTTATEREQAERDRLLYVAMTRAEKWLIVAAAGDLGKDGQAWYSRVDTAMDALSAEAHPFSFGTGKRLSRGDWSAPIAPESEPDTAQMADLPSYFGIAAPHPPAAPATLSPSDLGGAKALPGDAGQDEEAALRRGRQIHTLLEHLPPVPPEDWVGQAARLLGHGPDGVDDVALSPLLDEVRRTLSDPDCTFLFGNDALAEVPVSATLDSLEGRRVHGVIDRLLITPDYVLAVDFKTNAEIPTRPEDTPEGLLRQMGAYAAALALLYPDRRVDTALLWTAGPRLMRLPHDLVTTALSRAEIA
ncbi:double-strand break repair helicase AddA [Sediminimonas qiaohouensis]|uniref:double-strand break repair helicase AddA n=1 Tax=Sediminimonas qiaohouensis TaxID=552061 RepID=UPI00040F96FB|nr:double-strand break repair helicase AddA [Sediminimonas qiaohouensis]